MLYFILEKKANDLYVIYDVENGGMCCCTPYTIKQLMDMGHTVRGVSLSPKFNVAILTKSGELATRNRVYDIDTTKRSAVTIAKGLKPTRQEKKALKEVVSKRNATRKQNQKIERQNKIDEEKRLKEEQKQKEKLKKEMEVKISRYQKSKCLLKLYRIYINAGEYNSNEEWYYEAIATTPAGLTALKKLVMTYGSFDDLKNSGEIIRRGGVVRAKIVSKHIIEGFLESDIQLVADKEVRLRFVNEYEGSRLDASFNYSQHFKAHVYDNKGVNEESFGASAYSDNSLSFYEKYLRKTLGVVDINI